MSQSIDNLTMADRRLNVWCNCATLLVSGCARKRDRTVISPSAESLHQSGFGNGFWYYTGYCAQGPKSAGPSVYEKSMSTYIVVVDKPSGLLVPLEGRGERAQRGSTICQRWSRTQSSPSFGQNDVWITCIREGRSNSNARQLESRKEPNLPSHCRRHAKAPLWHYRISLGNKYGSWKTWKPGQDIPSAQHRNET